MSYGSMPNLSTEKNKVLMSSHMHILSKCIFCKANMKTGRILLQCVTGNIYDHVLLLDIEVGHFKSHA